MMMKNPVWYNCTLGHVPMDKRQGGREGDGNMGGDQQCPMEKYNNNIPLMSSACIQVCHGDTIVEHLQWPGYGGDAVIHVSVASLLSWWLHHFYHG